MLIQNDPHNTGSTTKPPILVKHEYKIWQRHMTHFLSHQHTGCWRSVMFGPYKPTVTDPEDETKEFLKNPKNYSDHDFTKLELDVKAFAMLALAIPNEIYSGLLHCSTAKELWDALKEQFGRTPEVIANNHEILNQQYETFCHVKGETLTQQFERFTTFISGLKMVEQTYTNCALNNQFLRYLPDKWDTYAIVLRSNVGFSDLSLTQLHGKLFTFEREVNQKKKLQTTGRSADDYVPRATALFGDGSHGQNDQPFDHFISTGFATS